MAMRPLSVLVITKNAEHLLDQSLSSVKRIASEIVVVDAESTDKTLEIAQKHNAHIYVHRQENFGKQRVFGLARCTHDWVLMLDADEIVPETLEREIIHILDSDEIKSGYQIPYQNHFLGRPLCHGGEVYSKLVLFNRNKAHITSDVIHEHAVMKDNNVGILKSPMLHFSYESIGSLFSKFTGYAKYEAARKTRNGEHTHILKPFLYGLHMFYARYVKDQGYKDHVSRIVLDLGFGYMEFLTYVFMFFQSQEKKKSS